MHHVNWFGVLVGAVTFMAGGLWYSPLLFVKAWARESGVAMPGETPPPGATAKKNHKHPASVFGFAFLFSALTAFAIAVLAGPHPTVLQGVHTGLLAGLGVAAAAFGINYQFAGKSWLLLAIDGGYHTVHCTLVGLVLGLFG